MESDDRRSGYDHATTGETLVTALPHSCRRDEMAALVRSFAGKRILVVGDMVADEYITGLPTRISREAPVLILDHSDQFTVPGGATNPGVNARTLGAEVLLAGVIGEDAAGERLRQRLREQNVSLDGVKPNS